MGGSYSLSDGADEKLKNFLPMEISTSKNRLHKVRYY